MPGGVCAVLDYEVEAMADYVAEMATRVVTPDAPVTSGFRKFVSQILTSTRLPSTTILLGMNYLAKRVNTMKSQGPYKASEGQVWRYLTVSLLLGSKFLDDNTFQNRSWSEVSGIAVSELNSLEFDWVQAMGWRLYVNLDLSKDYQAWLENWREWQQIKKRQAQPARERLASLVPAIDTELARYSGNRQSPQSRYVQDQVAEYERYQAMKAHQHNYRGRDMTWSNNPWNAPLTPPDSGYGTPDSYAMSAASSNARYNDWFSQAAAQYNGRYHQASGHNSNNPFYPARQASYAPSYGYNHHHAWEHGQAECSCATCVGPLKQAPYFASHAYGQPVMG
ncbi:cyclin-like protein [Amphichorda felina]